MNYPFMNYNDFNYSRERRKYKENTMKVLGEGIIMVDPDSAIIKISIITKNKDLKTAKEKNSSISSKVINELIKIGIDKKDISTIAYNIQPQYDYIDGKKIFREYKVTNTLKVIVRELEELENILSILIESGVNEILGVSFTSSKLSQYYNKALRKAIENSKQKAFEICETLGVEVNPTPINIEEEPYIYEQLQPRIVKSISESIVPAEIKIKAKIQAIFKYFC